MNALDWILIAIVALSVLTAAARGLLYEIWMMVATIGAILVAAWEFPSVEPWLTWLHSPEVRSLVAFILVAALVLIAAMALGRLARGVVRAVGLGWMDRLLGAGLGFVRGLILGAVLVFLLTAYPVQRQWLSGSHLAPAFLAGGRAMEAWVPRPLARRFEQGLHGQIQSGLTGVGNGARWQ